MPLLLAAGLVLVIVAALAYECYRSRGERSRALSGWDQERAQLQDRIQRLEEQNEKSLKKQEEAESILSASMGPSVAKLLVEKKVHNEKRRVTILFADLVNFTAETETSPPEHTVSQLNQAFSAIDPAIPRFKGHLDKFIGDGLMAEFGAPHSAHHHSLLGVLAGISIQKRLRLYKIPWKMRIGIASGVSLVGLIGSETRKSYTAIGDAVNLASRLQALCPEGSICVDEEVYEATKRWVKVHRLHSGLKADAVRRLELRLRKLGKDIESAPSAESCLEAANICSDLGDMRQALRYHKMAIEQQPKQGWSVERIVSKLLSGEDRAYIDIKGKKERVAVYEVQGLKDFLGEGRVSPIIRNVYHWLKSESPLPEEWILSIEAIEGRLGHAQVTAAISGAIADAMKLGPERTRMAFIAGYLNDVGKKNIPEHLLCYEGRLQDMTPSDRTTIYSHVQETEAVLKEMPEFSSPDLLRVILQHHERYDGKGYPKGLKGEEIDLLGRIVRVADTYEALTAWRSYQDAMTRESALMEICRDISDGAIDPAVGKVFLELMNDEGD